MIYLPETIPAWFKPLVGTKFIVTLLAMTGAMLALANGWIDGGTWLASLNLSGGAFILGNAYVTNSAIKSGKPKDDENPG